MRGEGTRALFLGGHRLTSGCRGRLLAEISAALGLISCAPDSKARRIYM